MFYNIYLTIGLDGIILFGLISYILYILFGMKPHIKNWQYVLCSTLLYAVVYNIPHIADLIKGAAGNNLPLIPFWYHFATVIILSALCAHFVLKGEFLLKLLYVLLLVSFIQEYKIVCSPLYNLRPTLTADLYELLDFSTFFLLYLLLFLLSLLFRKTRINGSLKNLPHKVLLIFYFPISFLAVYIVTYGIRSLQPYSAPLLSAVIMSNLPVIYYYFATIIQAYEEQKRLDKALYQTMAQLDQYRHSMEMQEQIRKERHELRNNYFYIQALLKEQKYEKLDHYLDNVIGKKMDVISEISSGNTLMDHILNSKIQEARKSNIKIYSEILVPKELPINNDRVCTILLNLLDNAIEASVQEPDPDIHIQIKCSGNYLICKIENKTCLNVLEENPDLHSTKKDAQEHGLGIRIINETVTDLNGMINYSMEGDYFCASLMLPITPNLEGDQ